MGNSYTRQSSADIIDGQTIFAAPLNAEFNAIQNFADGTSGHTHDGTVGEGPKINLVTSITGMLPIVNGGTGGIHKLNATVAPTANDDINDGYAVGSIWVNTTADTFYVCVDATAGAAVWIWSIAWNAALASISALTTAANQMIYTTAPDAYATTALTPFGRTILDDVDAAAVRTTIGLGSMATQNSNSVSITGGSFSGSVTSNSVAITGGSISGVTFSGTLASNDVNITGGSITGITDLAIADGGTGASTAANARSNLGLVIGTDVQAQDAELSAIAGLTSAADKVPYFTGSGTAALADFTSAGRALVDDVDASAQRTTLGLGNVDNTSDLNKPVSTATTTALNAKVAKTGDTMTGNLTIQKASFPLISFNNGTNTWNAYYDTGDGKYKIQYNGAEKFSINTGGQVSTSELGDLNSRIEARALAWANDRVNQIQSRLVSRNELDFYNPTNGTYEAPSGTVITGYSTINSPSRIITTLTYRYLQVYNPASGWISCYYA